MALRQLDAVIEQLLHGVFVFDLLDDQLNIEVLERALHVGGGEGAAFFLHAAQEGARVDLDEAERAFAQADEIDVEIGDVIQAETIAERAKRIERAKLGGTEPKNGRAGRARRSGSR